MNDRFKFRVYRKSDQKMYEVYNLHTGTGNVIITERYGNNAIILGDYTLMQCTGLKDKNGTLIYEGDIVRFYDDTICIIKWDDESGMFCTLDTEGQAMIGVPEYYEVLGNIYENPELAKEIKETRKNKEEKNNG